jgi:ABC-type nickel/cobalt efflux system permease component RcnA
MRARGVARLLWALALAAPLSAAAHPMGNFSISHYAAIQVEPDGIRLHYLLDLAEIPTFQTLQDAALRPDPEDPAVRAYAARAVETLADGLLVELDGRRLALHVESSDVIFPPGAGGLPTLKLGAVYRAALPAPESGTPSTLTYRDGNYPERAGWKEIVVTGTAGVVILVSTAPDHDRSRALTDYPTGPAASPPQLLDARVVFARRDGPEAVARTNGPSPPAEGPSLSRAPDPVAAATRGAAGTGGSTAGAEAAGVGVPVENPRATTRPGPGDIPTPAPSVPPADPPVIETLDLAANVRGTPRNAFTALLTEPLRTPGMILFALAVAASLGAFHALEPGHGKTVVAAYLVGARGTAWHAVLLGLVVTASHTAGVYLLGGVTLYASRYVVPERLYPWLGAASGVLIVALGANLLYWRLTGGRRSAHGRTHELGHADHHGHPGHDHSPDGHHHGDDHGDEHHHHHHLPEGPVSLRALVALGISGGIVPCPAALVVLLGAMASRQIGLGLLLIGAFSAGLAAVLIAIGLLVVCARRLVARFDRTGVEGPLVHRWLPLASASVMTVAGLVITAQALTR